MTDIKCESDISPDGAEKVAADKDRLGANCSVSDASNRSKSKNRNKKRKDSSKMGRSHRSSRSSRQSTSSQRTVDEQPRKESLNSSDRRSSSDNHSNHSLIVDVKEELHSDDQHSSVSDNRPLLLTRARIRRIERRKAYSSNSSAIESDHRKTKSEPIIITLDSDSDDNVSVISSNRPNRSARIRGELIRKLSGPSTKIAKYTVRESSSSSEIESRSHKKKSKSKSAKASSSQAAKRKKYLVNHLSSKSRLKLKKHSKTHVAHVYRPLRKSLRKQLERKNESLARNLSCKRSSHQSRNSTERRKLRSSSVDIALDDIKQEISTINQKIEKVDETPKETPEKSSDSKKTSSPDNKKHSKKEEKSLSGENKDNEGKTIKEELTAINKEDIPSTSAESMPDSKTELTNEETKAPSDSSMEVIANVNEEDKVSKDNENTEPESNSVSSNIDMNTASEIKAELQVITSKVTSENTEILPPIEENREIPVKITVPRPQPPLKLKKKKMKPSDKILRKRGRPRLSEMKPVKEIPILNDMIQIPFLQSSFCFNVSTKLPKCRECRIAVNRCNRSMLHAYCRFMEYRKLCYSKNGTILNAGFSEPSDATPEHLNQWLPQIDDPPKDLNCNTSKALIEHIGDQFCDLVDQEEEALTLHIGRDKIVTWKRIVQGVREMCDVCYTTLFNIHWVCPICGLAVCIDCYKGRKQGVTVEYEEGQPKNRDQYNWLLCTARQPHDPEKLVMAQIIPGDALSTMRKLLHKARKKWDIPSYCKCNPQSVSSSDKYISTGICKQLMCFVTKSFSTERANSYYNNETNIQNGDSSYDDLDFEVSGSALKWLEGSVMNDTNSDGMKGSDDYFNSYEDFASLRGNLLNGISADDSSSEPDREINSFSLDDIIKSYTSSQNSDDKENKSIKHFSSRYPHPNSGRDPLPIRIYTKLESNLAFNDVPHSWFCNGRLLFLLQSDHVDNLALFQEQWKRGQPILVKGVDQKLSIELWHPDAFCRDFGEIRNDLVDCRTGAIIKNLPMKRFWEGFESFAKRLKDDDGEYMLLKLKDWPPGEDFSEMLPRRFHDLMRGLPLPEYTHRDGILNLAGRLPSWFVRPDLGPKMYNAYGSALYPTKGTTNLHLDISDAVNVMVYVGIPQDGNAQLHIEEALKAIDEGGCDSLMRARVRARGAKPGALWHIYNARDADKIRELLNKVAIERGEKLEAHHDPIHDQSWYLDAELRKRLYRDYGVEGYAIAQCLGDAVFIPAGAPHQVRNLHSCVKVAEDFVSPENIAHCFKLTQEFRHLSDTHTNHEDKLQIKNIIYHVVRDALAHLLSDTVIDS